MQLAPFEPEIILEQPSTSPWAAARLQGGTSRGKSLGLLNGSECTGNDAPQYQLASVPLNTCHASADFEIRLSTM
jgi:hypothetical protein